MTNTCSDGPQEQVFIFKEEKHLSSELGPGANVLSSTDWFWITFPQSDGSGQNSQHKVLDPKKQIQIYQTQKISDSDLSDPKNQI